MLLKVQFPGKVIDFVADLPLTFDFEELFNVFIMHVFNTVSLSAFLGYIINAQFLCQWLLQSICCFSIPCLHKMEK